jgi:ComF family protein
VPYFLSICLLCDAPTGRDRNLCPACEAELPWIASACRTCGLPLPEHTDQLFCGECLRTPSPFELAITPLHYRQPLSQLITGFKHHHQLIAGELLGDLLAQEIRDHYLLCGGNRVDALELMPEVILPVPLHWTRRLWRGYNQSILLGKQLGRTLDIPCHTNILKRVQRTPSQQGLGREDRLRNLKGAFRINAPLRYQRVALLDDVVTTGATATEIAQLLLKNGAEEIHLWAIARTPL